MISRLCFLFICIAVTARCQIPAGRNAALLYCQNCHLFPEPELLDRETWTKGALPQMAPWLGVAKLNLASRPDGKRLDEAKVFPSTPVLSQSNWVAIKNYYAATAAAEAPKPTNKP